MTEATNRTSLERRHRAVAAWMAGIVVLMGCAAYGAAPLYSYLCRVTNFDGTPRRATAPSTQMIDKTISVRFDANVAPGFPWRFEQVQTKVDVKLGENVLAFYRATNTSDRAVKGTATYNVFPEQAAAFFNKVQCFCFTEQELQPGESVEFPVSFFIDPQMLDDKDARDTTHITLSYTFYPVVAPRPGLAETPSEKRPAPPQAAGDKGKAG
jgi:cytochrome c oxidase assembly protein subunit 11